MKTRALLTSISLCLVIFSIMLPGIDTLAADTTAVLGGGVAVNEILIDPNSDEANFDTDQNGTAEGTDEFVELYNASPSTIDISGWQLWDASNVNWFTFPGSADDGTTTLAAGAYAVVVVGVQSGGTLPVMTNPASVIFDAAKGSAILNNAADNVVLYDPGEDEYIQLLYNGDTPDDPTNTYVGFPSSAARVGQVEDWGSDQDGKSLTRYPSGDTNVVIHDSIPGAGNASPTAITLTRLVVVSPGQRNVLELAIAAAAVALSCLAFTRLRCRRLH